MDALDSLVDFARLLSDSSLSATPTSNGNIQHNMNQDSSESNSLQLESAATPTTRRYALDVISSANRAHSSAMTHEAPSATYSGREYNAVNHLILKSHTSRLSNGKHLVQYQDREMECVRCARQDFDYRYAPLWTSAHPMKSLTYGEDGTNISYQYSCHPHYTNEVGHSACYSGGPYEYCGDRRCRCRAAVPILEQTMESYISSIINGSHVREKR